MNAGAVQAGYVKPVPPAATIAFFTVVSKWPLLNAWLASQTMTPPKDGYFFRSDDAMAAMDDAGTYPPPAVDDAGAPRKILVSLLFERLRAQ